MINQVIYEKKLNYYNTNYDNLKINKYLNKLNIYGGAEEINLAPDQIAILSRLPVLNRGSFGIVKQQGNFVIKQFTDQREYEDEKMMYISKLTIPGGIINLREEKYSYIDPNGDVTKNKEIDLNEDNIKKMPTDNYHIKGNLLEYLKDIKLTKAEKLQIINFIPRTQVDFYLVITRANRNSNSFLSIS